MPELPEVETVLRGLAPVIEGQRITKAAINRLDLRWPFPENMALRLERKSILQLRRRSKYILADLSSKETLLIHLGMSGRVLISGNPLGRYIHHRSAPEKHDHVVLQFDKFKIVFNDPRRFGMFFRLEDINEVEIFFNNLSRSFCVFLKFPFSSI